MTAAGRSGDCTSGSERQPNEPLQLTSCMGPGRIAPGYPGIIQSRLAAERPAVGDVAVGAISPVAGWWFAAWWFAGLGLGFCLGLPCGGR